MGLGKGEERKVGEGREGVVKDINGKEGDIRAEKTLETLNITPRFTGESW